MASEHSMGMASEQSEQSTETPAVEAHMNGGGHL